MYLMALYRKMVDEIKKIAEKEQVRFVHLGRKDRFPKDLMKYIAEVETETQHYEKHIFNVALDYGGHDELLRAINKMIKESRGKVIKEKDFEKYLDTAGQPYPYVDLFIRTSGEQRTSGLLPWQMTYAEMYWEVDHLPDFTPEKLKEAILDYSRRRRRFGGNDAEEHLKFNPKLVAGLEIQMQKDVTKEAIIDYLKEQYGMTKELAKEAGIHLLAAMKYREKKEWYEAKSALRELYGLVKKNVHLAFEPEIVANIEVKMWQDPTEDKMKELLAEKFRVSSFQATKSAHLAILAQKEAASGNWEKARGYFEKYYSALKERVA